MRETKELNRLWAFRKNVTSPPQAMPEDWDFVKLPHTWNGLDGQDGGGDYWRGTACYVRKLPRTELPQGQRILLRIPAAGSSADVFVNGTQVAHHDGGYATFVVELTDALQDENLICMLVDNSKNTHVYPQNADFTFYGGLYRGVELIGVPDTHLDTETDGTPGVHVIPRLQGESADVLIRTHILHRQNNCALHYLIQDAQGQIIAEAISDKEEVTLHLDQVHRWQGRKDPYLYTCRVELLTGTELIDCVQTRFGCREYQIDPEKGFILNGESYPLRGVCRHQDRPDIGNALSFEHHLEDINLICEMGANTIRLAHYQHAQAFYDLCDERGLVVWAEIPYISAHMPEGRENTLQQMRELIVQNMNHPSIVVWGLSNEITMITPTSEDMLENHRMLNDLAHRMDPTRLTTMAVVSMCSIDDPIVHISDVVSYNLYFGWYGGEPSMNGPWMDTFHEKYPHTPIGMSEYGAEALNWHSGRPHQGDYTEEYQALYHEELIKQLYSRPYIWATHVWNMFDFAADARNEGGENGMNHKGLVSFDRKYKKDAFYAYKAWLSDDPFVHIAGKRYVDRVEDPATITVYSNAPEVELFANGVSLGKKTAGDHFFRFEVPNQGSTSLVAVAGHKKDFSEIHHVDTPNPAYILQEKGAVLNWTDITEVDGYYSLNDTLGAICESDEGRKLVETEVLPHVPKRKGPVGDEESEGMRDMMRGFTILRLIRMTRADFSKETLLAINEKLNKIPRKDGK